jgi:hypothetical protein
MYSENPTIVSEVYIHEEPGLRLSFSTSLDLWKFLLNILVTESIALNP